MWIALRGCHISLSQDQNNNLAVQLLSLTLTLSCKIEFHTLTVFLSLLSTISDGNVSVGSRSV